MAWRLGNTPQVGKKRPLRTARRERERAARSLVKDREKLFLLSVGGSADRPIEVDSPTVIPIRVRRAKCPQCEGEYTFGEESSPHAGLRVVKVQCRRCQVQRELFFRLVTHAPN